MPTVYAVFSFMLRGQKYAGAGTWEEGQNERKVQVEAALRASAIATVQDVGADPSEISDAQMTLEVR